MRKDTFRSENIQMNIGGGVLCGNILLVEALYCSLSSQHGLSYKESSMNLVIIFQSIHKIRYFSFVNIQYRTLLFRTKCIVLEVYFLYSFYLLLDKSKTAFLAYLHLTYQNDKNM
jgi:hypothetical protein